MNMGTREEVSFQDKEQKQPRNMAAPHNGLGHLMGEPRRDRRPRAPVTVQLCGLGPVTDLL